MLKKNIKTTCLDSSLSMLKSISSLFYTLCYHIVSHVSCKMCLASCCCYGKSTTLSIVVVVGSFINTVCYRFCRNICVCRGIFRCLSKRIFLSCVFVSNLLHFFISVAFAYFITLSMTMCSCFACIGMLFSQIF